MSSQSDKNDELHRLLGLIDAGENALAANLVRAMLAAPSTTRTNVEAQQVAGSSVSTGVDGEGAVSRSTEGLHGGEPLSQITSSALPAAASAPSAIGALRWIPLAERMPEHGDNVLFMTSAGGWYGWRRQEDGVWLDHFDDGKVCTDLEVKCWMPFPSASTDGSTATTNTPKDPKRE